MRQLLYVSDSLIGFDQEALDALLIQARNNNAIDDITGLLWTDGRMFAQVIEGEETAIGNLLAKLKRDPRHKNLTVIDDVDVMQRHFGDWFMASPAREGHAELYERRMRQRLTSTKSRLGSTFWQVVAASRPELHS